MTRFGTAAMVVLLAVGLAGCGKPLKRVNLIGSTTQNMVNETARPTWVRIYELKSPTKFMEADYAELLENDVLLLGDDLKARHEITVDPEPQITPLDIQDYVKRGVDYIGIFAGLQNYDQKNWRDVLEVKRMKGTTNVWLDSRGIVLKRGN